MRLWTLQHKSVLEVIERDEAYAVAREKSYPLQWENPDRLMLNAYDWLVAQMVKRVGEPPSGVEYPVWAWAKQRGSDSGEPNTTQRSDEARERLVLFELEVPEGDAVLTDFDLWHFALYCQHLPRDAAEEAAFDAYLAEAGVTADEIADFANERPEVLRARERAMESWERIIDYDIDPAYWEVNPLDRAIQATFWQLKPEYVTSATLLAE